MLIQKRKVRKKPSLEELEQIAVVQWFDLCHPSLKPLLYHTPNGGFRLMHEAVRLKKMGVRAGVPDLTLAIPNKGYHGLYIEMKTLKGIASERQLFYLDILNKMGYLALLCKGFESTKNAIEEYLKGFNA